MTMMSVLKRLKIDPLNHIANLDSPIGIYLRRELFRKETAVDAALKKELYEKIVGEQSADGSWNQLFVKTANNLWDLALLGFGAGDRSVKTGLQWLLSIQKEQYRGHPGFSSIRATEKTRALCDRRTTASLDLAVQSFTRQPMPYTCFIYLASTITSKLKQP